MVEYKKMKFNNVFKYIDLETMNFLANNYVITFKNNVIRYSYNMSSIDLEKFEELVEILFKQFLQIIQLEENFIYVFSYQEGWEKAKTFDENKIDTDNGLLLTDDILVLEEIFKKAMKYAAFPVFVDKSQEIAIIPTDHMDLFIISVNAFTSEKNFDTDTFNVIERILDYKTGDGSKPLKK